MTPVWKSNKRGEIRWIAQGEGPKAGDRLIENGPCQEWKKGDGSFNPPPQESIN